MTKEEAIKEYQCPGCACGVYPECFKESTPLSTTHGIACAGHCPGTIGMGIGTILLGMPKGFNRLGRSKFEDISYGIYESFSDFEKDCGHLGSKFCMPLWKHKDEHGNTCIRIFNPRTNISAIIVVLEDCRDKLSCTEITMADIAAMD